MSHSTAVRISSCPVALLHAVFWLALLLLAIGCRPAMADSASQARIYAGLESRVTSSAYRQQLEQSWKSYQASIGEPMAAWAKREIAFAGGGTVFYPFSGPDFVTVAQMFPNADRYVLVAIQVARPPADIEHMPETHRAAFQQKFIREWQKFGRLGFFRTLDLDDDLRDRKGQIGVTTLLMTFAARLGYTVSDVYPIELNAKTGEYEKSSGAWRSVRLTLNRGGKTTQLDYVQTDLSNSGVQKNDAVGAWLQRMAKHPVLLKAASHLLQDASFSALRDMLVAQTPLLVQDETGLDYTDLVKVGNVALYGSFSRPYELFSQRRQRSLTAAYKAAKTTGDLTFSFSYNKSAKLRCLQIARRK